MVWGSRPLPFGIRIFIFVRLEQPASLGNEAVIGRTDVASVRRSVTSTWPVGSGVQPGMGQPELATRTASSVTW